MSDKKRKNRNQPDFHEVIALITVLLQLISAIIELIAKLIE